MAEQRPLPTEPAPGDSAEQERVRSATAEAAAVADPAAAAEQQAAAAAAMEDRLLRALADLDNLRKRYAREVAHERAAERARVGAEWLPVVDNLERALQHAGAEGGAVLEGVRVVLDQALAVLARLGFPRYDDLGERFDPARHEAVGALDSDAPPGTVVAVVRPGYGTADRVLRPAGVVVAREARA